ncbi:OLC1v1015462C1 [Oldenlandia corymbosa var. corymbosa]|uniref:Receptor-like serine/threonine-protein kinase n=1 Tax=Oldenlandia corymbosa var. corymbosa TaxID=529605 RepID=A0AAV1E368_OLDCO|nr:OLC1v1015462C1 [Oldenlandia corymbosa var. corymbosa]
MMSYSQVFLLFVIIKIANLASVLAADIQLGGTLSASDPNSKWASPDSTFSFTFINDTSGASSAKFAAIVYDNNPGVAIWVAGGASPNGGAADSTATLRLMPNGNLELRNGSSNSLVWESSTSGRGVTSASLDNSGNFVLKNATVANIWSTFRNPTDTIVPTQNFTVNEALINGMYNFSLQRNGNLTLYWNNTIMYYNAGLNSSASSNLSLPSLSILPIGIIQLFDPQLSSPLNLAYSSDYAESGNRLRFVKLDNDGNLRIYSSDRGSGTKSVKWSAVSDQCLVFGYCGNMGVCSYNETGPTCGCPSQNFELVDAKDPRKGCKIKVDLQNCQTNGTMLELDHTVLLTYPPESKGDNTQVFSTGFQACRSNCLSTAPCLGSTSLADGTGFCYQKTTNFISGYQSPAIPSTSFFKICGQPEPNPPANSGSVLEKNSWRLKPWIVVVVVLVTILGLILLEVSLWWWCFRDSPKFGGLSAQYALLEYASGAPVQFSYKELQRATKGFKDKLGEGGFGAVYKGVLANRTVAAVKQLEGIEQGEKQFRMEVATISSTHHLNLVRLIGFCSEGRHRLLVYEFMKNGSLDKFLFSSEEQSQKMLNWETRYNIALGTARGITYLHEECRDCIVHCDIKPENILLDENYNAKVSDFGLAKLINPKDHRYRTLTSVRGTRGYLAPEWLANLPITSKSDIYSYGMVLLEIVSGRRNFDVSAETNNKKFSIWAYEEFDKGNAVAIIDPKLSRNGIDMEQVMRAIKVSFWCIQEQPSQRPVMGKVVQMLEGITEIGKPPVPKSAPEGSIFGSSMTGSNISAFSTMAASAPVPSSTSSAQTPPVSSLVSGKNPEKASSALIQSETDNALQ